ncbi:MAG: UDP-galactopyranose mutase [Deltaproteobacteria bacterium]|nr:UDP-galactopyranose mutase [Deltaproteobacteria bacterium]
MAAHFDTLIVGAGFTGSVIAECLAREGGQRVCIIERRSYVGGLANDFTDAHGVRCHRYGPHIFHTKSQTVWSYLSRFTSWRRYEHRVVANVDGRLMPFPINRDTINSLYGLKLNSAREMKRFLAERSERTNNLRTSEAFVVAKVGRDLYERFFRGYTRKQWGVDASNLDRSVCARIPIRMNRESRYYLDPLQGIPLDGYEALFSRILSHPNVEVQTSEDFEQLPKNISYDHLVYTGPIDRFYGYRHGKLPYRSIATEFKNLPTPDGKLIQATPQINYPSEDVPYTRSVEFRHLTGQQHMSSTIGLEFSFATGEPCYPFPSLESRKIYRRYRRLAAKEHGITFVGRLAQYQYLNMDQVVAQALLAAARIHGKANKSASRDHALKGICQE